jgi:hypothetical protein
MHLKSTRGRPRAERFWARVQLTDTPDGCWLWLTNSPRPYGRLGNDEAHRVAWELASGAPVPADRFVCHTCDVSLCVRNDEVGIYEVAGITYPRYGHLFLGDEAANMRDKTAKGRTPHGDAHMSHRHPERRPRGEAHGHTYLTDEIIRAIRSALADGTPQRVVAQRFGTSQTTVWHIAHGRTWGHVH